MASMGSKAGFQDAMDAVEALPVDDQAILVDVVRHRLARLGRERVIAEVSVAQAAYADGNVSRGSVAELMAEIDE